MGVTCSCCHSMDGAIRQGHVQCLIRAHLQHPSNQLELMDIFETACQYGNLECVEYLFAHLHGHELSSRHLIRALNRTVIHGHLSCIAFLHKQGVPLGEYVTTSAALSRRLDVMTYVHQIGGAWCVSTTSYSASVGDLQCLRYAHMNGAPLLVCALWRAAAGNHVDCMQFLVENGCQVGCPNEYQNAFVKKHRAIVAVTMSRRRSCITIQRCWRAWWQVKRHKAARIIENAYIKWACKPGTGAWYRRAKDAFCLAQKTQQR